MTLQFSRSITKIAVKENTCTFQTHYETVFMVSHRYL